MPQRIQSYRDLEVWQLGIELTLQAYQIAKRLPLTEQYELSRQIRRAASSIPANIAEGYERRGSGYVYHIRIALGSLAELNTHVEVAVRIGYLSSPDVVLFSEQADRVGRMLSGLRKSLMQRLASKAALPAVYLFIVIARMFL